MPHLIFFDGECALCNRSVRFLLRADHKEQFIFAPLQGKTAARLLTPPIDCRSLVLLECLGTERQRELRYGKGALRICWHLGGVWRLLGLLSFLPSGLADWVYRCIARNRHVLFQKSRELPEAGPRPGRFLD